MKLGSSKVISNTLRVVIWLRSDQSLSRKGEKVEFIYLKREKNFTRFRAWIHRRARKLDR